ncbi:MAG: type II toxin-antitoxin system HicA family toxin [Bryobacteraceae bacterium]|jgi:predicted RNA binding protein YcfA (HicA-like mRNA interferase family)
MPPLGPVKRRELVAYLRQLGFDGPLRGGRHQFMQRGAVTVILPNPHSGDIDKSLLARLLRQAGIERSAWESLS